MAGTGGSAFATFARLRLAARASGACSASGTPAPSANPVAGKGGYDLRRPGSLVSTIPGVEGDGSVEMRDVYVVAVGMIRFGKYPDKGIKDLTAMAMKNLFDHSPVDQSAIEAAWMSNAGWGMSAGQHCSRGQVALAPLGIGEIPIMNVENACAGGSSAFQGAWLGIAAGVHEVALAVGAEKTFVPRDADPETRKKGFDSFIAGTDVEITTRLIEEMRAEAEGARLGLTQNGGGFIGNGEAALAIHILEGPSAPGRTRS